MEIADMLLKKTRAMLPSFLFALHTARRSHIHSHTAHAAARHTAWGGRVVFGNSHTAQSVINSRPATEAAFCSAVRVTLVGSTTPACIRSPYSPVAAL